MVGFIVQSLANLAPYSSRANLAVLRVEGSHRSGVLIISRVTYHWWVIAVDSRWLRSLSFDYVTSLIGLLLLLETQPPGSMEGWFVPWDHEVGSRGPECVDNLLVYFFRGTKGSKTIDVIKENQ